MSVVNKFPVTVFDSTLTQVAFIDDYESASFTHGWYEPGEFSMSINYNKPNATTFQGFNPKTGVVFYCMWAQDVTKVAKVTHINTHLDEGGKGNETLTITGKEAWGIFGQRQVIPDSGTTFYYLSSNPEYVIKTAVARQAGSTVVDSNRAFPLLTVATNLNRYQAAYPTYTLSAQYTNLLDELTKCAQASQMGIVMSLDIDNKKLILDVELGVDRTPGNSGGNAVVILSSTYDESQTTDLDVMEDDYKNFVYVRSAGSAGNQTLLTLPASSIPTGMNRFEKFVSASAYQTTDATLTANLTNTGNQKLSEAQFTSFFQVDPLAYAPYVYGTDYRVGDILQISEFGLTQNVRLISMKETVEPLSYSLSAQYDKVVKDLPVQVAEAFATVVSDNANSQASPVKSSNASGSYVKFSEGTMIQYGRTTIANGGTITFPANFLTGTVPIVEATLIFTGTPAGAYAISGEPTVSTFIMVNTNGITAEYHWIAIGRWQ